MSDKQQDGLGWAAQAGLADAENYRSVLRPSESAPDNNNQGFMGDMVDATQHGLGQTIAGLAEAGHQLTGLESLRDASLGANDWAKGQIDQMSASGQESFRKEIFTEDESGDLRLGDGAGDIDTWLLQLGSLAGQVVPQVALGGGAASLGVKAASRIVAKSAARKAVAQGASKEVAQRIGIDASARVMANGGKMKAGIAGQALAETGVTSGMGALAAREEVVEHMTDVELDDSEAFQEAYWGLAVENPGTDTETLRMMARKELGDDMARAVARDPAFLLTNLAMGAVGGKYIDDLLRGAGTGSRLTNAGKQFVAQGVTEGVQGGMERYTINSELADQGIDADRDVMQGVKAAAANEAALGGVLGGVVGGVSKGTPPEQSEPFNMDEYIRQQISQPDPETGGQTGQSSRTDEDGRKVEDIDTLHVDGIGEPVGAEKRRGQYRGIDDDIHIADKQGFYEDAVRLRSVKQMFERAQAMADRGMTDAAARMQRKAQERYDSVFAESEAGESLSGGLPSIYTSDGELVGGELMPSSAPPRKPGETIDGQVRREPGQVSGSAPGLIGKQSGARLESGNPDTPWVMEHDKTAANAAKAQTEQAFTEQQGEQPKTSKVFATAEEDGVPSNERISALIEQRPDFDQHPDAVPYAAESAPNQQDAPSREQDGGIQYEQVDIPAQEQPELQMMDDAGIDYRPESQDRTSELSGRVTDKIRDHKLPENFKDPRLLREDYRGQIQGMVDQLVFNGGSMGAVTAEGGNAPSENPSWYVGMDDEYKRAGTNGFKRAVTKALAGEKLLAPERRAIEGMFEVLKEERRQEVGFAKQQRSERNKFRRVIRGELNPVEAGFVEASPELAASIVQNRKPVTRVIDEITDESFAVDGIDGYGRETAQTIQDALEAGVPEEVVTQVAKSKGDDVLALNIILDQLTEEAGNGKEITSASIEGISASGAVEGEPAWTQEPAPESEVEPALSSYDQADLDRLNEQSTELKPDLTEPESPDSFVLSGSDLPADQAEARGQASLLDSLPDPVVPQEELTQETPANAGVSASEAVESSDHPPVRNRRGNPFKTRGAAKGHLRNNPGYAVLETNEGFELRWLGDDPTNRAVSALRQVVETHGNIEAAVHRDDIGDVDFLWGTEGKPPTKSGKRKGAKGISHLIEARMRKDGLSESEAVAVAGRVAEVVATGKMYGKVTVGETSNVKITDGSYTATLVKPHDSNAWLLSGWENFEEGSKPDGQGEIYDSTQPTHQRTTRARPEVGASSQAKVTPGSPNDSSADIDGAANEAATSPQNATPDPTPAQIEAGNYKKGHAKIQGLDVTIENPRGSNRSGTDPDGHKWSVEMKHHYGYIKRTTGADGEGVDVFVGKEPESQKVFVIDQVNADGTFDEHKVMLGFRNRAQAVHGYKSNYEKGWKVGPVTTMTTDQFKDWLAGPDTDKPVDSKLRAETKPAPGVGVSENTVFTEDAAAKARELLRKKLGQHSSGIDPEIMQAGITLAGYHIEKGARTFAAYAKAMTADLGDVVKPYLKSWYMGVKYDPRAANFDGMDDAATVDSASVEKILSEIRDESARQDVDTADREGVPRTSGDGRERDDAAARVDQEDMAADQSEYVAESSGSQSRVSRSTGIRPASANVEGEGRQFEGGNAGDGRKGAGRAGSPDAGARKSQNRDIRVKAKAESKPTEPSPANPGPGNFHIKNPLDVVGGGQVARFKRNQSAIELFVGLRDKGRKATTEEQEVLAGYTGWGSFGQELFQGNWDNPSPKVGWEGRDEWLREYLGQSDWEGMQRSITNAHYTDPPTVMAMWDMVKQAGFDGGRVLEPSMGIGNFFGMMPKELKNRSSLSGIELDPVTGGMASLLYPDANVSVMGYQNSKTPDGFYDVVIGNWPFENTVIADRRYNRLSPFLHDYFFLKAIDQTRPGGLVIGITSKGTMDKKSSKIRAEMARKAELVAAFRLPSGAFEEYAGTKVVTDILILKKRDQSKGMIADEGWIDSKPFKTPQGEGVDLNEYYHHNPNHVIGTIEYGHGTTFNRPGMIVNRPENMQEELKRIVGMVPEGVFRKESRSEAISYVTNHLNDREGSLVDSSGRLFVAHGEHLAPAEDIKKYSVKSQAETAKRESQLRSLIGLRRQYAKLIDAERHGKPDNPIRKALRKGYQEFVKTHGPLNDSYGLKYLDSIDDPFYPSLASLERAKDGKWVPAAIFDRSTMRTKPVMKNPSIQDAYILARGRSVNPGLDEISKATGKSKDEIKRTLVDSGAVYETPDGDIEPSDIYLSGNVRQKLRFAKQALGQGNKEIERNIKALEKVIPKDVPYFNIVVQMGASWVPTSVYEDYIGHMLNLNSTKGVRVTYKAGSWKASIESSLVQRSEAVTGFGTPQYDFNALVNKAIRNQVVTIRRKQSDGSYHVDEEATKEVNGKVSDMRELFGEWIWSDPDRRISLEREYNEARNAYAEASFDGAFMPMEGMALSLGSGPFNLRSHQQNAIWRAIVMRKSLNAHEVGTGKTFTLTGIALESRRYGLARKPLVMAHNANSKSVAAEAQMMYPSAKILYIDNLSPKQIKTRMRQIANDDWDMIVMPHSLIDRLTFTEETLMKMARDEIADLEAEAEMAANEEGKGFDRSVFSDNEGAREQAMKKLRSPTAKDLVKTRNRIIETIKKQAQKSSRNGAIPFEELGIDMLLVDEVHEFKKPPFATRMQMKGLNTQASAKSIAMNFMASYIRGQNNGGNVHLFTGTPITNTLSETFHMMRYIMKEEMADIDLDQWDGWFGSFASETTDVEMNPAGEYEAVSRLSSFINVPELRRLFGQYMDVVFSDDMPEMKPRRTKSGKLLSDSGLTELEKGELINGRTEGAKDRPYKRVINENSDLSPDQKHEFGLIQGYAKSWRDMKSRERMEAMRSGAPESPIIHENLAAKASFDVRLIGGEQYAGQEGNISDHANSKSSRAIKNIVDIYRSNKDANQVIFTQMGLGTTATKKKVKIKTFSTVKDMVERLVQAGIPRKEIAVVDGSTSKDKRKAIADAMNRSEIRVVFGSTQSLGVGVNMQRNLRAMHHLDAPWMPGDLEQRNGRGHRQGNQWNTVLEYRYLTDRIDGRRWQVLAIKDRFIKQFLKSTDSDRVIEGDAAADEEGSIVESFSEAAGDPRILIRTKLNKKLEKLKNAKRLHDVGIVDAKGMVDRISRKLYYYETELADLKESRVVETVEKLLRDNSEKGFEMIIQGEPFSDQKSAQTAIDTYAANEITQEKGRQRSIGKYRGFDLRMSWPEFSPAPVITVSINGKPISSNETPKIVSLNAQLRKVPKVAENKRAHMAELESSRVRAKEVMKSPFHQESRLKQVKEELANLERDIEENPVAPPSWLRTGAPVESTAHWKGEPYEVTGHRWSELGWFVVINRDGTPYSVPYTEVMDEQGMALYEERRFEMPVAERSNDDSEGGEILASLADRIREAAKLKQQTKPPTEAALLHKGQVEKWIRDADKLVADNVTVVPRFDDLPISIRTRYKLSDTGDLEGIFDQGNGKAYVIADRIPDASSALKTATHEVVGHKGVIAFLKEREAKGGRDFFGVLDDIYKSVGRRPIDRMVGRYGFDYSVDGDRRNAVLEYIAHLSETGKKPSLVQRAVGALKAALRRLVPSVPWSETDVLVLIQKGRGVLKQPVGVTSGLAKGDSAPLARLSDSLLNDESLSEEQKEALSKIGPKSAKETAVERVSEALSRWRLKLRQGLVDKYAALMEMDKQVLGGEITTEENITRSSWVRARMSGAASGAVTAMMNTGRIYLDEKEGVIDVRENSNGLVFALNKLGSAAEVEKFFGWIAGNRADKLREEGRENLFDDTDIDALKSLNRGTLPDGRKREAAYQDVFTEFQQYRDDVLAISEKAGVITAEDRALWRDEFYVPFYRIMEDEDKPQGPRVMKGLSRQEAYKKLKGGTQNVNDLLQNTIMNFHHLVDASMKNLAAQQAIDNAEALGIAELTPEAARDKKASTFVLRDGKQAWYNINDPFVYQALTSLNHTGMNNAAMKVMRGFKRMFTNFTTSTPQFIIANAIRDSLSAIATTDLKTNPVGNMASGIKAFGVLDRHGYQRARLMASGGAFSFGHAYGEDAESIRISIDGELRRAKIIRDAKGVTGLLKSGWDRWQDVSNSAENANRMSAFNQAEEAGKGKLYAAFQARDLMDFSGMGAWPAIRFMIDTVPFLNARIQGLDKLYRSGVKPTSKVVWSMLGRGEASGSDKQAAARFMSVVGALSVASIALYLHNKDDEEFQKAPDWMKDTYWWIRSGDDLYLVPKPFEVGAIATMAERLVEQAVDDKATGKLFAERMGHMMTSTFAFNPMPQIAQPLLDIYSNKDAFTGRDIETMGQQRLSPSNRVSGRTSEFAQGMGVGTEYLFGADSKLTLSPVQIDHLIGGYFGQIGTWAVGLADVGVRALAGEERPHSHWYEYQPVRRFYRDLNAPDPGKYQTLFYESLREAAQIQADIRHFREAGELVEAAKLANDNKELMSIRRRLGRTQRQLSRINAQIRQVERGQLSAEEKRRKLDLLKLRKEQLIKKVQPLLDGMR
ncbi:MAG: hypothetical protein K6L60_05590 [Oceanobacter sp.]